MSETRRILDQLERAYGGDAWHGPPLTQLLHGVTAEQAAARPLAGAHSIWEIVLHVTAWKRFVRRALAGEPMPAELARGEDWPPAGEPTAKRWQEALAALREEQRRLEEAVAALPDRRLEERVPGRGYSFYVLLHGILQHDLYHGGQIALLRKG